MMAYLKCEFNRLNIILLKCLERNIILKIIKTILPSFILKKIEGRDNLKNILFNINWLTFEKMITMLLGLLVGAWVARYLGPEDYGKYNYAVSFVALFTFISTLGLEQIVVRNIVEYPEDKNKLLGTTFFLRLIGAILLNVIVLIIITIFEIKTEQVRVFIMIISVGYIFKSFDTIKYWFRSQIKSKYSVLASTITLIMISLLKIFFILNEASVSIFVWLSTINILLIGIMLVIFYQIYSQNSIFNWRLDFRWLVELLKDSWPLILSGAAVAVHMRIDQVMIGSMVNDESLGIYSAAVKLKQWSFFAVIIANSVFPTLVETRKRNVDLYYKRLQTLYDIMIWFGLFISISVTVLSNFIIQLLYGPAYLAGALVLSIQSWETVFNFFGITTSKYLIAENLTKISFYRTFIGAAINISLNFLLIPNHGIIGASVATLISVFIQGYFSTLFFPSTRRNFFMFFKSLNLKRLFRKV
jgi:O-antigen/teichoic acid export membrane protein